MIGPGRVGSALLDQSRAAQPRLARDSGLELKLCGVVASKRMWLDCDDTELNARHGGTLARLCNRHDGAHPFSALVREAHALGYTEPDPRDDLPGLDVARKLVILGREADWPLSLEDVDLHSLVPEALATLPRDEFMDRLHELDAPMAARLAGARAQGGVLRHVAHLDRYGHARLRPFAADRQRGAVQHPPLLR